MKTLFSGQRGNVFSISESVLFIISIFKEGFWTFFLGWQYVALGVLIVVIVIYFPEGLMGWLREKYPERFGEVIDEKDRKAQVELK